MSEINTENESSSKPTNNLVSLKLRNPGKNIPKEFKQEVNNDH